MKKNQIILISIGVLVLIGIISYFAYFQKIIKSGAGTLNNEEVPDLCTKFSGIPDEITCQRAREIALEKYLGEVLDITNATTSYRISKPPEIKTEEKDVWIIKIKLKEPILPLPVEEGPQYSTGEVGVVIDRYQGEVLFLQTFPGK